MIEGARAQPSPYWVRRRLALAGMRPIDALVDATNYTMLDTGQPLHAFDYQLLEARADGKPIIVTRPAKNGEKLTTLDGTTHTLDDSVELVTDSAGPLSLAGIMGGSETGIHQGTQTVVLEAASWNFINIRKTNLRCKLNTEASYVLAATCTPLSLNRRSAYASRAC